nr:BON domain-containing protein [Dyella flava]
MKKTSERLGLRDPEEPSQGPLRLDAPNYSIERLTPAEGAYNEYTNDEASYLEEEDAPHDLLESLSADDPSDPLQEVDESSARNDLAILDDINVIITGLRDADATSIDITVQNGVVILDGAVNEAELRSGIEQAIELIPDVNEIRNRLTVRGEHEYPRWGDE